MRYATQGVGLVSEHRSPPTTYAWLFAEVERLREANHALVSRLDDVQEVNRSLADHLREAEHRCEELYQHGGDGYCSIDSNGIIEDMNATALGRLGYHVDEVVGTRRFIELLTPAAAHKFQDVFGTMVREARISGLELEMVRRDGHAIPIRVNARRRVDVTGTSRGFRMSLHDLTEVKSLQAQCRHLQKREAIGPFLGGIAHDFNNILSPILCYTELALHATSDASRSKPLLDEVLAAGNRARNLVKQVLAYICQRELERQPVQLNIVFDEVQHLLRAAVPATIEIRVRIATDACVFADPTQLHQVVMNLCTNANYAMRATGGILELSLDEVDSGTKGCPSSSANAPGSFVRLMVRDTGCGIEPSVQDRIFDPFVTTKGKGEGSGMGLAVVRGIVESYGGTVTVESIRGRGTTFSIFLPRIESTTFAPALMCGQPQTGNERILLVDDDASLAQLGKLMLESLGYTVVARTSAVEALEAFLAAPEPFDLVVTDQTMPHMTGDAFARKLLDLRPDLPVILCTGFSHTFTAEAAAAMGIRAYLMKPLMALELTEAIRRICDGSELIT